MTPVPLCLPVDNWPEGDRERWLAAQAPARFLEAAKPASGWSPARRTIVELAYGQWLSFLLRHGLFDEACAPGARVSDQHLRQFVDRLRARVAPASAAMIVGALLRMLTVIEPERDWSRLSAIYSHLKRTAKPTRDKPARIVPAADLFALGMRLMDTCQEARGPTVYAATRYRDGLMIAMLIACPIRLGNLSAIEMGRHLTFDGQVYRLTFSGRETKTGRPYNAPLPPRLTAYVDGYLSVHRPLLQSIASRGVQSIASRAVQSISSHAGGQSGPLWWSYFGRPLTKSGIRKQIEWRTQQAFGKAIWPHLFRDCAVTELVDVAPQEIGIAPDVLGHTSLATTQKHYILSKGTQAHWAVQDALVRARREARERLRGDDRGADR